MVYYSEAHFIITNAIMSGNPSKKMKFDFQTKNDGNAANEDEWDQDYLTAEEFDRLEIEATQSCNQTVTQGNHVTENNFVKVDDDLKQHQYELEGRVKLLSHSLQKTEKELKEERLNREKLINERMKEYSERETNLRKEVERMQSVLEFKDQEVKSISSKMQMMKSQLQVRSTSDESATNSHFEDLLKSSKSGATVHDIKPKITKRFHRKHKLVTDTPKGETKGIDILSSILFTRLTLPSLSNFECTVNSAGLEQDSASNLCTSASVVKLKNEQKCYELLEYYSTFLKNHITMLKTLVSKNSASSSSKTSPTSVKQKEAGYSHTVISYLRDIAYIFSYPKSNPITEENCDFRKLPEYMDVQKHDVQLPSCDPHIEGDLNTSVGSLSEILQSLSELANPKTYPTGYPKNEEIEFSLSVLLVICSSNPEKFLDLIGELPIYSFLNPLQNVTAICIMLKLLTVLCCCGNFISFLTHQNSNCIFCLIADYLINIVPHYPEKFEVSITLVEDFLSLVFSTSNFLETLLETSSECISEVIQGLILSIWKYYQVKDKISLSTEIIKKGFLLLHFMSCSIPNFKERRNPVENQYISLISNLLALSKENTEFREFYDRRHSLWDFQTDTTEFDLDDSSEETQSSADDMTVDD